MDYCNRQAVLVDVMMCLLRGRAGGYGTKVNLGLFSGNSDTIV